MQRQLCTLLAASTALLSQAQLAPNTAATLQQHMTEVNAEWRVMDPVPTDGARAVRFHTEAERIALHLHRVHDFLSAHAPEGLSAYAMAERTFLLDKLEHYADRGLFPINDVLPYRNPVFIDRVGTACAVGQLMIESGRADLAQRIHEEMNLAYVHDMHRSDVDRWAVEHGFSEDELAWIQPGYPPNVPWSALGGGTDQVVQATLRLSNGDLLVAGQFTEAGGVACSRVARWNGSTYVPMPGFPELFGVSCAAELDGMIYVGGAATDAVGRDLMMWDGDDWTGMVVFEGKNSQEGIQDLFVHDGTLYAAGTSTGFAGTLHFVKRLNGDTWEAVGQALNGHIESLDFFDGHLVCGGRFTGDFPSQATDILHAAYLDNGTWRQLGDGLDGGVHDLLVEDGQLYAGGDCVTEMLGYFGLARIAPAGTAWEPLMPNITNYMYSPADGLVGIYDMVAHDGHIYLGGDFDCAETMVNGMGVAVFNGTADDVHPFCAFGGAVYDVEVIGANSLVAAGTGPIYDNIAVTDLATGIAEHGNTVVNVWPNPTAERLTVELPQGDARTAEVRDAAGRVVLTAAVRNTNNTLDVRALANGTYTLRLTGDADVRTARFVKH